jgi:hypothetical protein
VRARLRLGAPAIVRVAHGGPPPSRPPARSDTAPCRRAHYAGAWV